MVLRPFWAKHRGSRGVSQHPHTGAGCVPHHWGSRRWAQTVQLQLPRNMVPAWVSRPRGPWSGRWSRPSQASSVGHALPTQLPWEGLRQGKKDGRGSAGGRRLTGGGTQVPRPALDPRGPPEGSRPLRCGGRTERPGGGASAVRRPRGSKGHRVARGGPPLLPASAVSHWPARAVWATGAR